MNFWPLNLHYGVMFAYIDHFWLLEVLSFHLSTMLKQFKWYHKLTLNYLHILFNYDDVNIAKKEKKIKIQHSLTKTFHLSHRTVIYLVYDRSYELFPKVDYLGPLCRDKMRAEGPNHYPYILGMALNQYRIDNEDYYLHYITKPLF